MKSLERADYTDAVVSLKGKWEKAPEPDGKDPVSEYTFVISEEVEGEALLSLEVYLSDIKVLINGQEVYSYEDPGRVRGVSRHWIPLGETSPGTEITLSSDSGGAYFEQTIRGNSYLGNKAAVYARFLKDNLYALLFALFALSSSGIVFFFFLHLKKKYNDGIKKGLVQLSLFMVTTGVWILSDSQLLQLVTGKTAVITLVSFSAFMIMPVFLILFIKEMLIYKKKFCDTLCYLYLANLALWFANYCLGIMPIVKTLPVQHILIIVSIVIIMKIGIEETVKYENHAMRRIVTGFGLLAVFGVAALIVFYINPEWGYPYLYSLGIILFLICLMDAVFQQMQFYMKKSARAEIYERLALVDSMTCIGNRTAFMEAQSKENHSPGLAYIVFDINNLKNVNDRQGHSAGDRMIVDVAVCMKDEFENAGSCFRIGGDEFVVMIPNTSEEEIERLLNGMDVRIARTNLGREIPIEIAYGYAVRKDDTITVQELFRQADSRMYLNKQRMKSKADIRG